MKLFRYLVISACTFAIGIAAAYIYWLQARRKESAVISKVISCVDGARPPYGQPYFPPHAFINNESSGEHLTEYFSNTLAAMNEPSVLAAPACLDEEYRFLWLRSFRMPVSFRIWKAGDKYVLRVNQLDECGQITSAVNRELNKREWDSAIELIGTASFWELPTSQEPFNGYDGANWVLEGYRAGKYHVVERWSPADKDFRASCVFMAKLSGLPINEMDYIGF